MNRNPEFKRIDSLTGLRFFFIITIVLSHFEFLGGGGGGSNIYDRFFHNGSIGVVYFFVISGFGLSYKFNCEKDNRLIAYGVKQSITYGYSRVRKIYGLYIATILLMVPTFMCQTYLLGNSIYQVLKKTVVRLLIAIPLLQSLTGIVSITHAFNGVAWYLSCALFLYIGYPTIERINQKVFKKAPKIWLLGIMILQILLRCLLQSAQDTLPFDDLFYSSPIYRVCDFTIGVLVSDLYLIRKKATKDIRDEIFAWLAFATCIICYCGRNSFFPGKIELLKDIIERLAVVCLVYSFAIGKSKIASFWESRKMVYLGSTATFIFLIHYPIRITSWFWINQVSENTLYCKSLTVFLTVAVTVLSIWLIEKKKSHSRRLAELN